MATGGRLGTKALTAELKKLAAEVHTVRDNGEIVTREQALADLLWKQALGWEESSRDENGTMQTVKHPPIAWSQQFMWERIEGKAPIAQGEHTEGMRAAEKVRELAKERINKLANSLAIPSGPPSYKGKSK